VTVLIRVWTIWSRRNGVSGLVGILHIDMWCRWAEWERLPCIYLSSSLYIFVRARQGWYSWV
jgi:hypothetical protein